MQDGALTNSSAFQQADVVSSVPVAFMLLRLQNDLSCRLSQMHLSHQLRHVTPYRLRHRTPTLFSHDLPNVIAHSPVLSTQEVC